MSEAGEGDIAVVLSSELIAKITQEYFNKVMFKQKVEIVDLKPASDGYMFSVAFAKEKEKVVESTQVYDVYGSMPGKTPVLMQKGVVVRGSNGKFTKKEKV